MGLPAKQLHWFQPVPQVRILSSPHNGTLSEQCPELEPIVLLLSAFAFVLGIELSLFPRTVSEISRK